MAKQDRTDNIMAKQDRTDNIMAKQERTDNIMAKQERTDNIMAKQDRTDNIMAKQERTNNDLQNTTQKAKNRATRTQPKFMCSGKISNSCSTSDTHFVTVKRHEHHLTWKSC